MAVTVGDICKIILAVILPPLGVFAEKERCDKDVLINILLTVLGYIPGRRQLTHSQRVAIQIGFAEALLFSRYPLVAS